MQGQNSINLFKKAVTIAGITTAGLFIGFPASAFSDANLNQDSRQLLAQTQQNNGSNIGQNSNDINNVDTGDRNTSPEVNREQNRPGTGSDSDTRQNLTDENSEPNRIMQNRTGNQTSPNNTNTNTNNERTIQNRSENQTSPNNTQPQSENQINNTDVNSNNGEADAVRGLW